MVEVATGPSNSSTHEKVRLPATGPWVGLDQQVGGCGWASGLSPALPTAAHGAEGTQAEHLATFPM